MGWTTGRAMSFMIRDSNFENEDSEFDIYVAVKHKGGNA
jgi:hypothetical protein